MTVGPDEFRARRERDVASLVSQISYLEEEIALLRRKVSDSPRQVRALEERLAEAEGRAAFLSERNDKLAGTLREAREQLVTLKEEVERLGQPPSGYGVFLERFEDGTVDVFTGGGANGTSGRSRCASRQRVAMPGATPMACSACTANRGEPPGRCDRRPPGSITTSCVVKPRMARSGIRGGYAAAVP